jgi:16S rRNA processing protein RimM
MKTTAEKYVSIGKFGKTHGLQGYIKVYSNTDPIEKIMDYQPWYIKTGQAWQIIDIDNIKQQGTAFVVLIKNINDPETACAYTNKPISIPRSQLPKPANNEYYWTDLEGLTVTNQDGEELGKIDHLMATGSNDVIVIQGKKRHLIPFILNEVIVNIDLANKTMQVKWGSDF